MSLLLIRPRLLPVVVLLLLVVVSTIVVLVFDRVVVVGVARGVAGTFTIARCAANMG